MRVDPLGLGHHYIISRLLNDSHLSYRLCEKNWNKITCWNRFTYHKRSSFVFSHSNICDRQWFVIQGLSTRTSHWQTSVNILGRRLCLKKMEAIHIYRSRIGLIWVKQRTHHNRNNALMCIYITRKPMLLRLVNSIEKYSSFCWLVY